jgi:hypothetical protein
MLGWNARRVARHGVAGADDFASLDARLHEHERQTDCLD